MNVVTHQYHSWYDLEANRVLTLSEIYYCFLAVGLVGKHFDFFRDTLDNHLLFFFPCNSSEVHHFMSSPAQRPAIFSSYTFSPLSLHTLGVLAGHINKSQSFLINLHHLMFLTAFQNTNPLPARALANTFWLTCIASDRGKGKGQRLKEELTQRAAALKAII